jgi:hypothetical protein
MAIATDKLIEYLLLGIGAVLAFLLLTTIISAVVPQNAVCKTSVSLVAANFGKQLSCQIAEVDMPERIIDRDEGQQFMAEKMLECWSIFGNGNIEQLRSQDLIDTASIVPQLMTGHFPDGKLSRDRDWGFWEDKNFCHVCSVVTIPEGESIDDMRSYLNSHTYQGKTYAERIYTTAEEHDEYFERNSDSFVPSSESKFPGNPGSARAIIFYTEGRFLGKNLNGVVAMSEAEFTSMITNSNDKQNLCNGYLT